MASMLKELPSMSTLLSAYASLSAIAMLVRTIINEMIPKRFRDFLSDKLSGFFSSYFSSDFTFLIEDRWHALNNETFRAAEVYLPTRVASAATIKKLLVGSNDANNIAAPPKSGIPVDTTVVDEFRGMVFEWTLKEKETNQHIHSHKKYFQLKCKVKEKEEVISTYLPHICKIAQTIANKRDSINIYTYSHEDSMWESTVFKHPATFETIAMDPQQKNFIIDDLDLFLQRKHYFESVGRAWKRGYLLYGPPGTGKSTLVAAIANYLRFHIYDLQLQGVMNDGELRRILTDTTNRSILLIEDIDCSTKASQSRSPVAKNKDDDDSSDDDGDDHNQTDNKLSFDPGVTLSGLLNFIDGLWSSCGDERLIIFTTNNKEKLDPALLRPGRMDVHIYMGNCTYEGFKKLSSSYLGIKDHPLFQPIQHLIQTIPVTPAEVAQHLMKCDKPQVALEGFIEFMNLKGEGLSNETNGGKKMDEINGGKKMDGGGHGEVIKQEVVSLGKKGGKVKQAEMGLDFETRCVYLS